MKFQVYRSLARGVLLESLRRKDLWVVAMLGFLIVAVAGALGLYGTQGLESFAKDLGVSVLSGFSAILAVLTSSRLIPEELKNKTLYPLLARPISRFDFLVGKLSGAILATWIAFGLLCLSTLCGLLLFGVKLDPIMLQYVLAKLMGLAMLCTVTLTLSIYLTPSAAATISFIFAFGSTILNRAAIAAYSTSPAATKPLLSFFSAVLPQYGLFDLGGRVANIGWAPVPIWILGALLAYAAIYSFGALALGWNGFRKRPI